MLVAKTLEVAGLTDDATKAFARMVRQKLDNEDFPKLANISKQFARYTCY